MQPDVRLRRRHLARRDEGPLHTAAAVALTTLGPLAGALAGGLLWLAISPPPL